MIRCAGHFCYTLVLVVKVVCGCSGISCLTPSQRVRLRYAK
nr:DUF3265 domain-containing protein [Vibrio lentus]